MKRILMGGALALAGLLAMGGCQDREGLGEREGAEEAVQPGVGGAGLGEEGGVYGEQEEGLIGEEEREGELAPGTGGAGLENERIRQEREEGLLESPIQGPVENEE